MRYLIILMDTTSLKQDYREYRFATSYWWLNVTNSNPNIPYSHSYVYQNYVFGLSKVALRIYSDPSFSFILEKNSGSLYKMDIDYYGTYNTTGFAMMFNYAIFPLIICSSPSYPYFNTSDGLCWRSCPRLQYMGTVRLCSPCRFDCLTCYN
jgi:hypothetical protein